MSYTRINVYEYDTNNNAFKNVLGFNLLLDQVNIDCQINIFSINNIVRHTISTIQDIDVVFEPYLNNMKYDYNQKGYPIEKISYDALGNINEVIRYNYN